MSPEGVDADAQCPVDHQTREKWLEAAKAKGQQTPGHPSVPPSSSIPQKRTRFSLDSGTWQLISSPSPSNTASQPARPRMRSLSTSREISTIPRASSTTSALNSAEQAALPTTPANNERDTGHDRESGNWIYPSQEMFFSAMQRKGHAPNAPDMATIVPIHNAVNEKAWAHIREWERGRGSEECGGPKLVSFAGDSKALTPRARWRSWVGYEPPFDRHDWVVDRCGKKVDYVIDFYAGRSEGVKGPGPSFYLDVRPKLNSWEAIKTRALYAVGL